MDKLIEGITALKNRGIRLNTIIKMVKDIYFESNKLNKTQIGRTK